MEYLGEDKSVNKIQPLISVCISTYQHANYIEDCIEGVLMQNTNFQYEVIIGEDDSTDGTRDICIEYAEKHPDRIRLFLRSEKDKIWINGRKTGRYNFIESLKTARGKYIAWCDGDDYWTDQYKLQQQVEVLEKDMDIALCFHPVRLIHEKPDNGTLGIAGAKYDTEMRLTANEVFNMSIATSSVMFRKKYANDLPSDLIHHIEHGDILLWACLINHGSFYYSPVQMSVYRRHHAGIYSGKARKVQLINSIRTREKIIAHEQFSMIRPRLRRQLARMYRDLFALSAVYKLENIKYYLISTKYSLLSLHFKNLFHLNALFFFSVLLRNNKEGNEKTN